MFKVRLGAKTPNRPEYKAPTTDCRRSRGEMHCKRGTEGGWLVREERLEIRKGKVTVRIQRSEAVVLHPLKGEAKFERMSPGVSRMHRHTLGRSCSGSQILLLHPGNGYCTSEVTFTTGAARTGRHQV